MVGFVVVSVVRLPNPLDIGSQAGTLSRLLLLLNPSEIPDWYERNCDCYWLNSATSSYGERVDSANGERVDASLEASSKVLPRFSVCGQQCCQDQADLNSAPEIHSKHVQGHIYNYCQGN